MLPPTVAMEEILVSRSNPVATEPGADEQDEDDDGKEELHRRRLQRHGLDAGEGDARKQRAGNDELQRRRRIGQQAGKDSCNHVVADKKPHRDGGVEDERAEVAALLDTTAEGNLRRREQKVDFVAAFQNAADQGHSRDAHDVDVGLLADDGRDESDESQNAGDVLPDRSDEAGLGRDEDRDGVGSVLGLVVLVERCVDVERADEERRDHEEHLLVTAGVNGAVAKQKPFSNRNDFDVAFQLSGQQSGLNGGVQNLVLLVHRFSPG